MCTSMFFFFQAEDGIRDYKVTGVQTCALPISLYDLLAPHPALPHVELRLAPGRGLHLVAEPLRRHERVLEGPLALGEPPRALLERGELLPEQRVLLQHGLVVVRDVVEERVHFVLVEAAEHPHRELLLPDVEGTDSHRTLRLAT